MKAKLFVCVLLLVLCVGSSTHAALANAYFWIFDNAGGDYLWSNPDNWYNYYVPTDRRVPTIDNTDWLAAQTSGGPMIINGYAETYNLSCGNWSTPDTIELTADGYLYLAKPDQTGNLLIGEAAQTNPAVFTNNGGTIVATGGLYVGGSGAYGDGSYIQNSGTVTLDWVLRISPRNDVQLNGGTITCGNFQIDDATATMDIIGDLDSSAHLYFGGYSPEDAEQLVLDYMADGRLTANDGAGTIQYEFDTDAYKMHVWAVPEPATMIMLALGGLLVSRKRK